MGLILAALLAGIYPAIAPKKMSRKVAINAVKEST
jgi:hypothetical protein